MTLREDAIELIYEALSNSKPNDDHYGIATSLLEKLETAIPVYQAIEEESPIAPYTSPAITYPDPIEFESLDDFLERVGDAIAGLEGAGVDIVTSEPLALLKSIDPEVGPADLRWLGDMIGRNYERFNDEIAARELKAEEAA